MKILSHRLEIQVRDPDEQLFQESLVECLVEDKRLLSVLRYEDGCDAAYAVVLQRYVPADVGHSYYIGQEWRREEWEMVETSYFSRRYHALGCFEKVVKHFIYG